MAGDATHDVRVVIVYGAVRVLVSPTALEMRGQTVRVERCVVDLRRGDAFGLRLPAVRVVLQRSKGERARSSVAQTEAVEHEILEHFDERSIVAALEPRAEHHEPKVAIHRPRPARIRGFLRGDCREHGIAVERRDLHEVFPMRREAGTMSEQVSEIRSGARAGPRRRDGGIEGQFAFAHREGAERGGAEHLGEGCEVVDRVARGRTLPGGRLAVGREDAVRFVVEGCAAAPHERDATRERTVAHLAFEGIEQGLAGIGSGGQGGSIAAIAWKFQRAPVRTAPMTDFTGPARKRIIVALDFSEAEPALRLAHQLVGRVGMFKVGLELFVAEGPTVVRRLREQNPDVDVFLDLKLHDIPNTMRGAIRSARDLGARFITVHAGSGVAHLAACVEEAAGAVEILAVTVLTSMDRVACEEAGHTRAPAELVEARARCAVAAGCAGIVCSGEELNRIGAVTEGLVRVVPGIRPQGSDTSDQKRVMTPASALAAGATYLVIGRPITQAADPAGAAEAIARELDGVDAP